ncbi:MAG: IclR family transcriptional regulator C-terminal domain-containing protein, partial [Pseudomonadota bacterium]
AGFTWHTITDAQKLRSELAETRTRGYAVDSEEKNLGMRCIAAPVRDMAREAVAGISVSGPTSRVGMKDVERLCMPVMEAATDLSRAIGGEA